LIASRGVPPGGRGAVNKLARFVTPSLPPPSQGVSWCGIASQSGDTASPGRRGSSGGSQPRARVRVRRGGALRVVGVAGVREPHTASSNQGGTPPARAYEAASSNQGGTPPARAYEAAFLVLIRARGRGHVEVFVVCGPRVVLESHLPFGNQGGTTRRMYRFTTRARVRGGCSWGSKLHDNPTYCPFWAWSLPQPGAALFARPQ
jgi:hypothetical protein